MGREEETVVDMTEETPLVGTKETNRSGRIAAVAAGTMGLFALVSVIEKQGTQGVEHAIPTSLDDIRNNLGAFAFIILVLCYCIRELINSTWEMAPGLKLFAFAVPFAIISGAGKGGSAADTLVNVGAIIGIVATVLDQLMKGAEWRKFVNLAAASLVIIGCLIHATHGGNIWDHLPFFAWAVTAGAWMVILVLGRDFEQDGFNDSLWLLVLFTASNFVGQRGGWEADCMRVGCILGVAFAVMSIFNLAKGTIQRAVVAVAYVVLWFPLGLNTMRNTNSFDAFLKNIALYAFAVTLAVRAVLCVLCVTQNKSAADDRTDNFCWLFVLYLTLANQAHFNTGGKSNFADAAAKMAQIGPIIGVITLVLALLNILPEYITKLTHVAECITVLGIFLG